MTGNTVTFRSPFTLQRAQDERLIGPLALSIVEGRGYTITPPEFRPVPLGRSCNSVRIHHRIPVT